MSESLLEQIAADVAAIRAHLDRSTVRTVDLAVESINPGEALADAVAGLRRTFDREVAL